MHTPANMWKGLDAGPRILRSIGFPTAWVGGRQPGRRRQAQMAPGQLKLVSARLHAIPDSFDPQAHWQISNRADAVWVYRGVEAPAGVRSRPAIGREPGTAAAPGLRTGPGARLRFGSQTQCGSSSSWAMLSHGHLRRCYIATAATSPMIPAHSCRIETDRQHLPARRSGSAPAIGKPDEGRQGPTAAGL